MKKPDSPFPGLPAVPGPYKGGPGKTGKGEASRNLPKTGKTGKTGNLRLCKVSFPGGSLPPRHPLAEVAGLLETAARIARGIVDGTQKPDRIDSVAWRAADALYRLRDFSEQEFPGSPTPGVHFRTGLGAKLEDKPNRQPHPPRFGMKQEDREAGRARP